jgi:outer membrane protein assembly factor BamD (BamD/ComL family)
MVIGALVFGVFNYYGQGSPERIYERGWALFDKQRYEEARTIFEKLRSMEGYDPMKVTGTFFVAQTYYRQGNYPEALKVFRELVKFYPESSSVPETLFHIGVCLERLGRIHEARQNYNAVIQGNKNERWANFSRERLQQMSNSTLNHEM